MEYFKDKFGEVINAIQAEDYETAITTAQYGGTTLCVQAAHDFGEVRDKLLASGADPGEVDNLQRVMDEYFPLFM